MTNKELIDYMWEKISEQNIQMINDPRKIEEEAIELGSKEKIDECIKKRYGTLERIFEEFCKDYKED